MNRDNKKKPPAKNYEVTPQKSNAEVIDKKANAQIVDKRSNASTVGGSEPPTDSARAAAPAAGIHNVDASTGGSSEPPTDSTRAAAPAAGIHNVDASAGGSSEPSTAYAALEEFYKKQSVDQQKSKNKLTVDGADISRQLIYGARVATQHMQKSNQDGNMAIDAVVTTVDKMGQSKDVIETAKEIRRVIQENNRNKKLSKLVEVPEDISVDNLDPIKAKDAKKRIKKANKLKKEIKKGRYDSRKLEQKISGQKTTFSVDDDLSDAKKNATSKRTNYTVNTATNKLISQVSKSNVDENLGLEGATKSVEAAVQVKRGVTNTVRATTATLRSSARLMHYLKSYRNLGAKSGISKFGKDAVTIIKDISKKSALTVVKSAGGMLAPIALIAILAIVASSMFNATVSSIAGAMTMYPSDPQELTNSSSSIGSLADAKYEEIKNIETSSTWSHIDEFNYDPSQATMLDAVFDYDMQVIMAYLSAKYQEFVLSDVQGEIASIYSEMFVLNYHEVVEIRYRSDGEGGTESYNYYILNTSLTIKTTREVVEPKLAAAEQELYDVYVNEELAGSQQLIVNPFRSDWRPRLSSRYGSRTYQMEGEAVTDFHTGIDMSYPLGTPMYAGISGVVTNVQQNSTGYGYHIRIRNRENTVEILYAHMSEIYVSMGDPVVAGTTPVGLVGSTGWSTGPHLHFEILISNAGGTFTRQDPIYFVGYATRSD